MKATAKAPSNIAFIKYWGKKDENLRIPANTSISMNLSAAQTTTTVDFSKEYTSDNISFAGGILSEGEVERIITHLERIRNRAGLTWFAKVATKNTFPKSAGIASSASGFAALTVAGCKAAGLSLSERELTIVARLGSGSASRSIPDGFVEWQTGDTSDESYAYSLFPHTYWDLRDVLCVVETGEKKLSSAKGMISASTSPHWSARLAAIPKKIEKVKTALQRKNMQLLGETIEEDCLNMHQVMQTQDSPLLYWNDTTKALIVAIQHWRTEGISVYFTIDAGPNVHCICEAKDERAVVDRVKTISGVQSVLINKPSEGTKLIEEHLFK